MTPSLHLNQLLSLCFLFLCLLGGPDDSFGQDTAQPRTPTEDTYYKLISIPIPEDITLEVGGMAFMEDGRLGVATRRGDVWIIGNPTMANQQAPTFSRFAHGLHEPLGLAYRDNTFYTTQRGELTRLHDRNGDGRAEHYETIFSWPLEGNYHEYSYGPLVYPDGRMMVTLNLAWVGYGASLSPWRGWMLEITPDGQMTPYATGMRSPAGFGFNTDGALFYAENQGDWIGSGYITHVEQGDFVGNPQGLRWTDQPGSPLSLKPEDIPDTGAPLFEVAQSIPALKPPAVWLPHTLMGISTSDILTDTTQGGFGPFTGQLFVGDQGHSKITRVFLEKVNGVYQGAGFPFREGFSSGVLRLAWGKDHSLFVGMTNRGWASTGKAPYGLQRLVWTGEVPFEVKAIRAMPDGFELEFTLPFDASTAHQLASYQITGFTYHYHSTYGSPPINQETHPVQGVMVSEDGLRARIAVQDLRKGYIHELKMSGVRSTDGSPLLHDVAYYTLNEIPDGPVMDIEQKRIVEAAPEATGIKSMVPSLQLAKNQTTMPPAWNGEVDTTVRIGTKPGLLFDLGNFEVEAGSQIRLIFDNSDDMLHNVVITRPGALDQVSDEAMRLGLQGHEKHYVPESDLVLYHTTLLEPGSSETIFFVAPDAPGTFPFVCTFPGHSFTMRGTMTVVP